MNDSGSILVRQCSAATRNFPEAASGEVTSAALIAASVVNPSWTSTMAVLSGVMPVDMSRK